MTYSGDVVVGGHFATRDLGGATLRKLAVGPMSNNAYLLTCNATGEQLLIDPAADTEALATLVAAGEPTGCLEAIIVTHRHADHIGALADVAGATGAPVFSGVLDAEAIEGPSGTPVTIRLEHGDTVSFGECTLDVIHLRGHTPGSIALAYVPALESDAPGDGGARVSAHLFTGDSLFPGGVGKTASPEDFASLLADVRERIFTPYDDDAWVYPGHGGDTTLGAQRPHLDEWAARGW